MILIPTRFILKTSTLIGGEWYLGSNPSLSNPGIVQARDQAPFQHPLREEGKKNIHSDVRHSYSDFSHIQWYPGE